MLRHLRVIFMKRILIPVKYNSKFLLEQISKNKIFKSIIEDEGGLQKIASILSKNCEHLIVIRCDIASIKDFNYLLAAAEGRHEFESGNCLVIKNINNVAAVFAEKFKEVVIPEKKSEEIVINANKKLKKQTKKDYNVSIEQPKVDYDSEQNTGNVSLAVSD